MERTYDIGQAACYIGVAPSTLRYWEDQGLVRSQRDCRSGYRRYTLHDLMEAGEVAFYRELGISVKALKDFRSFTVGEFSAVLADARVDLDERIEELLRMKRRVDEQLELNACAERLSAGEMSCETPLFRRLDVIDYDSPVQWRVLMEDPGRYGVYVDAAHADVAVEAVIDFGEHAAGEPLWLADEVADDVLWKECLLKCDAETGASNANDLFAEARSCGMTPLHLVGRLLLTASEETRCDWYQCWMECVMSWRDSTS